MAEQAILHVLFADHDEAMRGLVRDALEGFGLSVELATNGSEALDGARRCRHDVILTEVGPAEGGLPIIGHLRRIAPETPILVITSFADPEVLEAARGLGASGHFNKPVRMAELAQEVRRLARSGSAL